MQNNQQKKAAVIGIIQDAIIWDRVNNGVTSILNAFNPQEYNHEFFINLRYKGYENAFDTLELKNEDVKEKLATIYCQKSLNNKLLEASMLAESIVNEWNQYLLNNLK